MSSRVALVTGASRGIGRAVAAWLARRGRRVLASGRDLAALEALRGEHPAQITPLPADLAQPAGPERLLRALED